MAFKFLLKFYVFITLCSIYQSKVYLLKCIKDSFFFKFKVKSTKTNLGFSMTKHCHQKTISLELRNKLKLSYFYQRLTDVYGISILGSNKISIASMKRACFVLKFVLAEHVQLRAALQSNNFRVVILANSENFNSLSELSRLGLVNQQSSRSLYARNETPIIVIGEELVLCSNSNERLK
jgi:hypothetical protein